MGAAFAAGTCVGSYVSGCLTSKLMVAISMLVLAPVSFSSTAYSVLFVGLCSLSGVPKMAPVVGLMPNPSGLGSSVNVIRPWSTGRPL